MPHLVEMSVKRRAIGDLNEKLSRFLHDVERPPLRRARRLEIKVRYSSRQVDGPSSRLLDLGGDGPCQSRSGSCAFLRGANKTFIAMSAHFRRIDREPYCQFSGAESPLP